jgi:hypothetical protein
MAGAGQGGVSYDGARRGSSGGIDTKGKSKNNEMKVSSRATTDTSASSTGTGFFGDGSFNAPSVRATVPSSPSVAVDVTASTAGAELYE